MSNCFEMKTCDNNVMYTRLYKGGHQIGMFETENGGNS